MRTPPHPVLEASLSTLRLLHEDPKERRVLQEIGRLYHEGFPGAPKGVVPLGAVYAAMVHEGVAPDLASYFTTLGSLLHTLGLWRLSKPLSSWRCPVPCLAGKRWSSWLSGKR
jgi:hypothetical protein